MGRKQSKSKVDKFNKRSFRWRSCGSKRRFRTEHDAWRIGVASLVRTLGRTEGIGVYGPCRYCRGGWHTTSKAWAKGGGKSMIDVIVFTRAECNDVLLRLDAANDMLNLAQEASPECAPVREAKQDVSMATDMILKALRRKPVREVSNA